MGNKADLQKKRKVPPEDGASLALNNDYMFKETSCVKNENVADAFESLIEITNLEKKNNNNNTQEETIRIENNTQDEEKKTSGCSIINYFSSFFEKK